jgi:hypothetical protein
MSCVRLELWGLTHLNTFRSTPAFPAFLPSFAASLCVQCQRTTGKVHIEHLVSSEYNASSGA